jgi:hypothetical protein
MLAGHRGAPAGGVLSEPAVAAGAPAAREADGDCNLSLVPRP